MSTNTLESVYLTTTRSELRVQGGSRNTRPLQLKVDVVLMGAGRTVSDMIAASVPSAQVPLNTLTLRHSTLTDEGLVIFEAARKYSVDLRSHILQPNSDLLD
jgi:hypothetical protein